MSNIDDIFNIDIIEEIHNAEASIQEEFKILDEIAFKNQYKVLKAMQDEYLGSSDFMGTTGYGYGDVGRDKVEAIYRNIFHTEDALVRPSIASGTHAIYLSLKSVLKHGDGLLFASDIPYDTMQKAIGYTGEVAGSLMENGIEIDFAKLDKNNKMFFENIKEKIKDNTKVIAIQRSTGYSLRSAFTINEIEDIIKQIKDFNKDIIVFVDNCYGEFTSTLEPSDVGADLVAGSLIKNPGGGIALSGGYIVGRADLVDRCSNELTAPGIGKEVGLSFGTTRLTLQGLFLAPHIVCQSVKGATLIQRVFYNRGYEIIPKIGEERSDIVQTIIFKDPELLKKFAISIQEAGAVDSHAIPTAWDMPGYEDQVIMASPSFIDGSSIELSADAPMREPYAGYYQGGLTYEHVKIALMNVLKSFNKK